MVASKAECPALVYYTFADATVAELDTIVNGIQEKRWQVKDLMANVLAYCKMMSEEDFEGDTSLFDALSANVVEEKSD